MGIYGPFSWTYPATGSLLVQDAHLVDATSPSPYACPKHVNEVGQSYCFRADAVPFQSEGYWRLNTPLNVRAAIPGQERRLRQVHIEGMYQTGPGTIVSSLYSNIKIIGDGAILWQSPDITHNKDDWARSDFQVDIPLDGVTQLDIELYQGVAVWTGGVNQHVANIILSGTYKTDMLPETATVEVNVTDKESGQAISNARVMLMSGQVVEADDHTDANGRVTFNNIYEGSYTLKATASGYHPGEIAISVTAPAVSYPIMLAPTPPEPIPWWVLPAVAVGGIAVLAMVASALGRKGGGVTIIR